MKVVIAIQDNESAEALLPFVLKYPWTPGTSFYIVHVVIPVLVNSYLSLLPSPLTEGIAKERTDDGNTLVRHFGIALRDAWHSPNIYERVVEGDPAIELLDQVANLKPDVLVVGSHGKYGLQLLGSVSRHVMVEAPCSVLVVPIKASTQRNETKPLVTHLSDKPSTKVKVYY